MTARRRYLVCYDIREENRLRRVHSAMKGWGEGVQYSVFVCDLDRRELVAMRAGVGALINHAEDSVMIVDIGSATEGRAGLFEFLGTPLSLPTGGAHVV